MARLIGMNILVTPEEKKLIERRATAEKVSQTVYIRNAILTEAFISGDLMAARMVASRLRQAMIKKLTAFEGDAVPQEA